MSPVVFRCRGEDTLSRAAQLMWEHDCGCVPVVDWLDRAIGVITDRDVCMAAYTQGKALSEIPVSTACSRDVKACFADDSLEKAEQLMIEQQVRRLPVTNDESHLVGLLSLSDLARHVRFVSPAKGNGLGIGALSRVVEAVSRARAAVALPSVQAPQPHP